MDDDLELPYRGDLADAFAIHGLICGWCGFEIKEHTDDQFDQHTRKLKDHRDSKKYHWSGKLVS